MFVFHANNKSEVIFLQYNNLHDLIFSSSGTRKYFLSLPYKMQTQLYEHNDYIHSAADLRLRVSQLEKHNRSVMLSESLNKTLNKHF